MESYPPNLTSCVIGNSTPAMLANYITVYLMVNLLQCHQACFNMMERALQWCA
jgi:hypothetical protein